MNGPRDGGMTNGPNGYGVPQERGTANGPNDCEIIRGRLGISVLLHRAKFRVRSP